MSEETSLDNETSVETLKERLDSAHKHAKFLLSDITSIHHDSGPLLEIVALDLISKSAQLEQRISRLRASIYRENAIKLQGWSP